MAKKTKVGIIGVGNCFAGLVQGIEYYKKHRSKEPIGLMHLKIGSYGIFDLDFVSAFDVGKNKIGKTLDQAVFSKPNLVNWIKLPKSKTVVKEAPILDGIGIFVKNKIRPLKNPSPVEKLEKEIAREIKKTKTEILVNYLPVGSQKATEFWAKMALKTKCAFVNCLPVFIASDKNWAEKFKKNKIPIIGDDIKGQIGATIVHRILARLCDERGATIDKTYQINVGGNSVTGDQMILLRVDGKIEYLPIGKFIDDLMEKYKIIRADRKEIVVAKKLSKKIECFTVDENYEVKTVPIEAFIRHKINEPIFEIETEEGRKIKITKDHNVFILNEKGELEAIPARELKEEKSYLAVPATLSLKQKEKRIKDLSPYVKELHAEGIKNGFFKIHSHPKIKIPVKFPITDGFLRIVGLWLADGSFDRKKSGNIELACGNDFECLGLVKNFCHSLNINYVVRGKNDVALRLMSKTFANICKLFFGFNGKAATKRVPSWIFDLSDGQIGQVLKGYLSGDGGISGDQVRWSSISEELIEDIRTLFLRIGINSTVFKEKYKKNRGKAYPSKVGYCWHGIITSQLDLELFARKVGFIQIEKNRRLLEIFQWSSVEVSLPAEEFFQTTRRIPNLETLRWKWRVKSKTWYRNPTVEAGVVISQLDKIQDEVFRERIWRLCRGSLKFLKVRKISEIQNESKVSVYDISTKPYERFICSNFLVHNTDFLNMLERTRLESKKISKTKSVTSQIRRSIKPDKIYIGPSDFIPFLGNTKLAFIKLEGKMFADIPYGIELRLEVDDKANSAGIVIDAIRCAKLALDRKIGGYLPVSAYFMKHPLVQVPDSGAKEIVEKFIKKYKK